MTSYQFIQTPLCASYQTVVGNCHCKKMVCSELLAMIAPTVNSYTRLIPGFWAPTEASWGIENRTCALRAIPGSEKSQRVEFRIAAVDANPYITLCCPQLI